MHILLWTTNISKIIWGCKFHAGLAIPKENNKLLDDVLCHPLPNKPLPTKIKPLICCEGQRERQTLCWPSYSFYILAVAIPGERHDGALPVLCAVYTVMAIGLAGTELNYINLEKNVIIFVLAPFRLLSVSASALIHKRDYLLKWM